MTLRPTVLCPSDFSDASRSALRYACVLAGYRGTRLVLLAVEDPLLTEAIDLGTGIVWDPEETRTELAHFAERTLGSDPVPCDIQYEVAVGNPARQILQVAEEQASDLIVMSTHGLTGMRRMFFGSTTERVLRETRVPVLATPPSGAAPRRLEDVKRDARRVLAPVDLSDASMRQVLVASELAEALQLPLLLTHVVEPVRSPLASKLHLAGIESERKTRAEEGLNRLVASLGGTTQAEALVAYGDPAEEISKIARDRQAGLIVIGLHGSPVLGPRMGSVTYRVLCLTPALVLALPPAMTEPSGRQDAGLKSLVHR